MAGRGGSRASRELRVKIRPFGPSAEEVEARADGLRFEAVERALRDFEGPNGLEAPMSAHIVTATK